MADGSEESVCCRCSLEYASIACNRTPFSLDWGRNGLVVYGGCNCVVIYRPEDENSAGKILDFLSGHKDRVNCVRWIKNTTEPETEIVSGSTDKTVIVWKKKDNQWQLFVKLEGHTNTINSIAAITIPNNNDLDRTVISSSSADSTVKIWERIEPEGVFNCMQTIQFGYGFSVTVDLAVCPETKVPILACGNEDSKIYIFVEKEKQFIKVQSLVGHEDWIRGVEFTCDDSGDLLLASCSKDCFIRIWRISSSSKSNKHSTNNDKTPGTSSDLIVEDKLKLTSNLFTINNQGREFEYSVVLESVLSSHEDIVYSVHWQPSVKKGDGSCSQPLSLLSASFDKTLIIWKPDEESGVWLEMVRVGGVGGTTLGFFGGVFSPDGNTILGHSYQGAFHLWQNVAANQEQEGKWMPGVTVGGHFGSVQDICWDPEGQFLMSVSTDQTTRLHAPWSRQGKQTTWHEIARPQVHGYDMQCFTLVDRYTLASGADEKVVRIFKAPRQFLESLQSLSNIKESNKLPQDLPLGASVPALGLSNKAVFEGDLESLKQDAEDPERPLRASAFANEEPLPFAPIVATAPPTEEDLLQNTLWPESQKLYGHGFEIFCVASSPDGSLLASACKASKPEHASILLWDTKTWRQVSSLSGHTLTVTQMAFNHSGQRLLSVSRDRSWAVFKRQSDQEPSAFNLVSHSTSLKKNQQHSRIIWSCAWSHDDKYFVTASRDKKVIIWGCGSDTTSDREDWTPVSSPLDAGDAATAVDFATTSMKNSSYLVAVGRESGLISLYSWSIASQWSVVTHLDQSLCPVLTVKRLKWRPTKCFEDDEKLHLACCGSDHSVRIIQISGLL